MHYYFSDHLGAASVVASNLGVIQEESDYYPYGGERLITNNDPNHYKFTGKERDSESGLDEFGARYYASSLGRFMIPDWAEKPTAVPYANFGNPQSLNLYSYVQNNPTTLGDPDGHFFWPWPQGGTKPSDVEKAASAQTAAVAGSATLTWEQAGTEAGKEILTAVGEGTKDLVGGLIETLAAPLIVASYLISPGGNQVDQGEKAYLDHLNSIPPSTSQQGAVNTGPINSTTQPNLTVRLWSDQVVQRSLSSLVRLPSPRGMEMAPSIAPLGRLAMPAQPESWVRLLSRPQDTCASTITMDNR